MSKPTPESFYSDIDEAPQQGDILLGAVARIVADDGYAPTRWSPLDEHTCDLAPAGNADDLTVPALRVAAGRALVMVTTHDCGLDKEFNKAVDALTDPDRSSGAEPLTEEEAMSVAEARDDLDRDFSVSPLVDPDTVLVAGKPVDRGLLMAGRVIGYLPVPALVIAGQVVIPESVVDLGYRSTLDRLAYTTRIRCVSEQTREQLRFALAKLDVLRSPSLEVQLADAVGQQIVKAKVHKKNSLVLQLHLADGSILELLPKPGSPEPGSVSRSRSSVP